MVSDFLTKRSVFASKNNHLTNKFKFFFHNIFRDFLWYKKSNKLFMFVLLFVVRLNSCEVHFCVGTWKFFFTFWTENKKPVFSKRQKTNKELNKVAIHCIPKIKQPNWKTQKLNWIRFKSNRKLNWQNFFYW